MSAARLEAVTHAAGLVVRGLTTLTRELLSNAELRTHLSLTSDQEELMRRESAEPRGVVGRLDGFVAADVPQFIEFNSNPGAIPE